MSKKVIIIVVIVLLIGGGVFALTANKKDKTTPASTTTNNSQNQTANSTTQPTSTNSVSIENFAFSPPDITVKKGTTVTWTNNDSSPHQPKETDGKAGPDSGVLNNGGKYSFTFNETGTFQYHCAIHTSMLGTVTVTE